MANRLWNSFKIAFSMYSRIPMFMADWTEENMRYVMCFFPLIGIPIGLLMILWSYLVPIVCTGQLLKGVVYVLIPVIITGAIHLDGFLDTSDALSSHQPMERKLEILKDSHTGAFAIIVGVSYFLYMLGVFSEVGASDIRVLAVGFVLSRSLSGLAVVAFPKAKNSGLVYMFSDAAQKKNVMITMIVYIVLSCAAAVVIDPIRGAAMLIAAFGSYIYYYVMCKKQFGGTTGDLAGFFLQIAEAAMALFVLMAGRFLV